MGRITVFRTAGWSLFRCVPGIVLLLFRKKPILVLFRLFGEGLFTYGFSLQEFIF
jgi:hypothetical protein